VGTTVPEENAERAHNPGKKKKSNALQKKGAYSKRRADIKRQTVLMEDL